uniref:AlNc14C132G7001 protein n=1 Tax=Albugo laibachii Nc14 TaxID=890382 RepID=F0WKE9_9STRA|nr:AlNc14C132G7001 [Albugo laibachii Nc14]|eukprot:CCA21753.1 AlNc14C132G7001 [Albugo laibachii Nc14]
MNSAIRVLDRTRTQSLNLLCTRLFSSNGQIRRRKPIRLSRDEARRKVEPNEQKQQSQAVTNYQEQLPADPPFISNENAPQNLKNVLKEVFPNTVLIKVF